MNFFADENISPTAARLLDVFDQENEIRALEDRFGQGKPDTDWLSALGEQSPKPVIISGDGRILKNKAELLALRQANLMFVYLAPGWTRLRWEDFAWKIIKAWPSIVQNVNTTMKPTIFEVRVKNLKVERRCLVAELGKK